jgi:prepilin-type N-terminal cleavage/methylation domain-containing protein
MTCRPRSQGFTIMEVMVAIMILAVSVVSIFGAQFAAVATTEYSKHITQAINLAECRMNEIELEVLTDDGFKLGNVESSGECCESMEDEKIGDYECFWEIKVVELPNLGEALLSGGEDGGTGLLGDLDLGTSSLDEGAGDDFGILGAVESFAPMLSDILSEGVQAFIGNMEKDPNKIKSDSISLITTGYNPRTPILTKESVGKITLDDIKKIYTDRFDAADEFTFFIVGNIGIDTVKQMVEKYIGSIPAKGRKESWIDRKVEQPKGRITKEISLPLTIPKSTVFISFAEDMKYNPYNYLGLEVIKGILDLVYTDKVREKEGGTYNVTVSLDEQKRPTQIGEGMIAFDCDPARASALKAIIYQELDSIMTKGPSQENLDKTVNNLLKTREEERMHNAYWLGILSRYYSYGINSNDPANYETILKSFTVKDIKKIANKMFKKADVVDLVFNPAK